MPYFVKSATCGSVDGCGAHLKKSFLLLVFLAGCNSDAGDLVPGGGGVVPVGTASYTGNLGGTSTQTVTQGAASYQVVDSYGGRIALNANFNTGVITTSLSDISHDYERKNSTDTVNLPNYIEERSYSGTVTGTGAISGASFSTNLAGNLTLTSSDRSAVSGAPPEAFTGTLAGHVAGDNYVTATGTVTLGTAGQASFLSETPFTATKN